MITAYHGTSPENARKILSCGYFYAGTYFAFRKQDAVKFGGPVVFKAEFDPIGFNNTNLDDPINDWQFHLRTTLDVDSTVKLMEPSHEQ